MARRWLPLSSFRACQRGRSGVIFWEDIRTYPTVEAYQNKLRSMDDQDVEDSYAYQNFYVSRVLHRKHFYIRWAMVVTMLGVLMAVVGLLVALMSRPQASMMQRNLTPAYPARRVAAGRRAGTFEAVCLFADVSGFTALTTALMHHGSEGAEVVARRARCNL